MCDFVFVVVRRLLLTVKSKWFNREIFFLEERSPERKILLLLLVVLGRIGKCVPANL